MDQARTLREWGVAAASLAVGPPRVIAVTSGKGGVGKTNVVANLAVALVRLGRRVVVLDADVGLGSMDVLLGIVPRHTLDDVWSGQKRLADVIVHGPGGIRILPAGSGGTVPDDLTPEHRAGLWAEVGRLEGDLDVLLIDTGAGISSNVLSFNAAAQEIVVVASPEPASLTDAYAVIKVLTLRHGARRFRLVVNRARSDQEGRETAQKLAAAVGRFLGLAVDYLGAIPEDEDLRNAVRQQRAVVDRYPHARSSVAFGRLARAILEWTATAPTNGPLREALRRMGTTVPA